MGWCLFLSFGTVALWVFSQMVMSFGLVKSCPNGQKNVLSDCVFRNHVFVVRDNQCNIYKTVCGQLNWCASIDKSTLNNIIIILTA